MPSVRFGSLISGDILDLPEVVRYSALGVNMKSLGATSLGTVPAGKRFIPTELVVLVKTASGLSTALSLSIGTNGALYNNIRAITAMTGLSLVDRYLVVPIGATALAAVLAGTQMFVNVTTIVGGNGGTGTMDVHLFGYQLPT
jgi:hypothetical protein